MLTVGCGFQVRLWTAREARVVGGILSLEAIRNKKGRFIRLINFLFILFGVTTVIGLGLFLAAWEIGLLGS